MPEYLYVMESPNFIVSWKEISYYITVTVNLQGFEEKSICKRHTRFDARVAD